MREEIAGPVAGGQRFCVGGADFVHCGKLGLTRPSMQTDCEEIFIC